MRIDRCVCVERSFAEAIELSRREGLTLPQLESRLGCGTGCGLCRPYLRRALRTGQAVFHEIVTDRDEPATADTA
jgi:bacterioferritin-associated ferredoxin